MDRQTIDILLSTYNGEKWIQELLDSLEGQSIQDWRLVVRDDCSSDNTLSIIDQRKSRLGDRLVIIDNEGKNLGPCLSFASLLEYSDADYIMFCDQDDVWLPEKIEKTLKVLQSEESVSGKDTPILAHTDLIVTDTDLNTLSESFWEAQRLCPDSATFEEMAVRTFSPGCVMMLNRAARNVCLPFDKETVMHDIWVGMRVAGERGKIVRTNEATILYRVHGGNTVGVENEDSSLSYFSRKLSNIKHQIDVNKKRFKTAKKAGSISLLTYIWIKIKMIVRINILGHYYKKDNQRL